MFTVLTTSMPVFAVNGLINAASIAASNAPPVLATTMLFAAARAICGVANAAVPATNSDTAT